MGTHTGRKRNHQREGQTRRQTSCETTSTDVGRDEMKYHSISTSKMPARWRTLMMATSRRSCSTAHARCRPLPRSPQSPALPCVLHVDGYIGLGVPIGTDAFIKKFVKNKCQAIMEDVDKLDSIQDGFIHDQLIRFCQTTRLQYLNGHIDPKRATTATRRPQDFKRPS